MYVHIFCLILFKPKMVRKIYTKFGNVFKNSLIIRRVTQGTCVMYTYTLVFYFHFKNLHFSREIHTNLMARRHVEVCKVTEKTYVGNIS